VVNAAPSAAPGITPETQLSQEDVQALGVGTAAQVITELASQTQSASGEPPVILLNGRLVSGAQEINDIPAESIRRIEVLPEEASLAYGYSGNQRVINIVLQPTYSGRTVEAAVTAPTEGGRLTGMANGSAFKLDGSDRLNISVRYTENTALTEVERDLLSRSTTPFSIAGNVVGTGVGEEIEPALSAIAGRTVTTAGLPAEGFSDKPAISQFNRAANPDDSGRFRTLLGASRQLTTNMVMSKQLGDFTVTGNGFLNFNQSSSLRGLPTVTLTVPAGSPFSPFSRAATLDRYVTGFGPLQQDTDSWTGRLGTNIQRDFGSLRTTLTGSYEHGDNLTVTDVGIDTAPLQALLTVGSPTFNPFGPLPSSLILRPENKSRSLTDAAEARLFVRRPLFSAPAGQVTSSFRVSDRAEWISSRSERLPVATSTDMWRNIVGGQATVSVPLTSRRNNFLAAAGELSLNGNVGFDELSDFGSLVIYGGGLNWTPVTPLQLRASYSNEDRAPTLAQLNNPQIVTPASRLFDYVTGQLVDTTVITGGNRALLPEKREVTRLSMTLKPFSSVQFNLVANYSASRTLNPVRSFPAVTAEVQAAFPDRFVRNVAGNLVQFDSRPVNFAREDVKQLRWGFNFTHRLSAPLPARGRAGQGAAPGAPAQIMRGQGFPAAAPGGVRPPQAGLPSAALGRQRPGGAAGPGARQGGATQDFVALAGIADTNRDGNVTRQEWLAVRIPEALFNAIDDNKDNVITGAEMAALPARAAAAQQGAAAELTTPGQEVAVQGARGQAGPGPAQPGPGPGGGPEGPGADGGPPRNFEGGPPGGFGGPGGPGAPGGDFGGAGGSGGGFGGAGRGTGGNSFQLSVFHTVFFEDKLLARPGVPVFDRLNGSAAGATGGRPRHQVQVEAGYNRGALGLRLTSNLQSSTSVAGSGAGNLFFSDLTTTNLRLFANLGQMQALISRAPLLTNTRLTLLLNNVLNQRQTVRDANGATPLSYQPAFVDPSGRYVRLELRKQF